MELRKGRNVVHSMHVHLIFVTKYRTKVFNEEALEKLRKYFRIVCADFEADLIEFNGEGDHVHLMVVYPPKTSVSALVNSLKGVSSRRLRTEMPDREVYYVEGGLWSPSYFAGSVGGEPISVLDEYLEKQMRG